MSEKMPPIDALMAWYRSQCNGDWEHQHGVRIGTLDNPGWTLDVDLAETPHAGSSMPQKMIERSDADWLFVEIQNDVFRARGGSGNLAEMIELFTAFIEGRS